MLPNSTLREIIGCIKLLGEAIEFVTFKKAIATTRYRRDALMRLKQVEAGENAVWKPDFNKGQMLSSVLLLEKLSLLQLLTSGVQLRGSDEVMREFKAIAISVLPDPVGARRRMFC
jgi:hypothetical protein